MLLPNFSLVTLESVSSTNTYGLEHLRSGGEGGLWVRALSQSAGRGRRGRAWACESGNLFVSMTLCFDGFSKASPQLCFVAALALRRAVLALAPEMAMRIAYKWPNDLMLDGVKFSGILVEGELFADGRHGVVIGWGVNVAKAPLLEQRVVASLYDAIPNLTSDDLLEALMLQMQIVLDEWKFGQGFDFICNEWRKSAIGMGQRIQVDLDNGSFEAIMQDLDCTGQLIVLRDDGSTFLVNAGDVTIKPLLR